MQQLQLLLAALKVRVRRNTEGLTKIGSLARSCSDLDCWEGNGTSSSSDIIGVSGSGSRFLEGC